MQTPSRKSCSTCSLYWSSEGLSGGKGRQEEIKAVSLSLFPSPHPHEPVYLILRIVSNFLFGTVGGQEEDKQSFYRLSINILLGALIAKCSRRITTLEKM